MFLIPKSEPSIIELSTVKVEVLEVIKIQSQASIEQLYNLLLVLILGIMFKVAPFLSSILAPFSICNCNPENVTFVNGPSITSVCPIGIL
jgi:hypothetical protein